MFDGVDESTAIFKCLAEPPQGEKSRFVGEAGVAPDFYLRLTGEAGRLLRGEIPADTPLPARRRCGGLCSLGANVLF